MKTATMPNDPNTEAWIKVTAELTCALEDYEAQCRKSLNERVETVVMHGLTTLVDPAKPNMTAIVRKIVSDAILEVVTHIKIHERTLGLTAEQAPAENALKAIHEFEKVTKQYWDNV